MHNCLKLLYCLDVLWRAVFYIVFMNAHPCFSVGVEFSGALRSALRLCCASFCVVGSIRLPWRVKTAT